MKKDTKLSVSISIGNRDAKRYNKEQDLQIKSMYFPKFLEEVKEGKLNTTFHYMAFQAWALYVNHCYTNKTGGSWEHFAEECSDRLKLGNKKYGDDWVWKDLTREAEYEVFDMFNYPFLAWLQSMNNRNMIKLKEGKNESK